MNDPAVLRPGSHGEAVRDLQVRLAAAGHPVASAEAGVFGASTDAAVRAFQAARGLRVDGVCGTETWAALVESGYRLGDRLLYRRRPMLRGDDVAELQRRLNALGFDARREDGIFGDDTARALVEFQRNAGLAGDGVCGPTTVTELRRVGALADGSVASVRERDELTRSPRPLRDQRVFVGTDPGFEALGRAVAHELTERGARVTLDASGAPDTELATRANRSDATLIVAFRPGTEPGCRCSYFESGRFRSEVGRSVAEAMAAQLAPVLGCDAVAAGRAYALLRETHMAAVVCEPVAEGDGEGMRRLVVHSADLARAAVDGIGRGVTPAG